MQLNERQIKQNVLDDRMVSWALMASFVVLTAQYFVLISFNLFGTTLGTRVQVLSKLIVATVFVTAFPVIWRRGKDGFLRTYFVLTTVFLSYYLFFPGNRMYIKELIFPFFFTCLPAFVYSRNLRDWGVFGEIMEKTSTIVLFIGTILASLVFSGRVLFGAYSMPLSYYMLLPAIMYTNRVLKKPSFKDILLALAAMFIMLSLGSRGPFLCLGAFVALRLFRVPRRFTAAQFISRFLLLILGIIGILSFKDVLRSIAHVLQSFGIKSRSISLFLRSTVHLSGRDRLYEMVGTELLRKPIMGLGLAGDRSVIGGYVHNLFLEVLAHFGVIAGALVVIFLIFLIFRGLLTNDASEYEMMTIWFGLGFMPLMVSGSYLTSINFWILLGLLLNTNLGGKAFGDERTDSSITCR